MLIRTGQEPTMFEFAALQKVADKDKLFTAPTTVFSITPSMKEQEKAAHYAVSWMAYSDNVTLLQYLARVQKNNTECVVDSTAAFASLVYSLAIIICRDTTVPPPSDHIFSVMNEPRQAMFS